MDLEPTRAECGACGEPLTNRDWGMCVLCLRFFCTRHLTVRKGVANCAACADRRRAREQAISERDVALVVDRLVRDLATTIGAGHEQAVEEAAARIRLFCSAAEEFERRLVDDVQQYLHDSFTHTSWPPCPDHPHHPLWYSRRSWRCERSGRTVASLGGLASPSEPPDW